MSTVPRTYAEVEGLVTMLLAAYEDATINNTLQKLPSQPNHARKTTVRKLVERLRENAALPELIDAIVCLLDDDVAEKAYQAIYRCERREI